MLTALTLQAAAVAPALVLLWFFSSRDLKPEPARRVWAAFWAGILAMLLALAAALPVQALLPGPGQAAPMVRGFFNAFLTAAIPEECAKFFILLRFCRKNRECDEPMDCVVYGVAASLGFATLENLFYVNDGGLVLAAIRAVSAVPNHAMDGAIMGYYLGRALFSGTPSRGFYAKAMIVPILFHGLYDFPLLGLAAMNEAGMDIAALVGIGLTTAAAAVLLIQVVLVAVQTLRLRREQRGGIDLQGRTGPESPPRAAGAWAAAVLGALLTSAGGIGSLLLILGMVFGQTRPEEIPTLLTGGAILFLAPLVMGLALFIFGLRRLKQKGSGDDASAWRRYGPGRLS